MVYSNAIAPSHPGENLVSFAGIWSPIVANLGAELIEPFESGGPISQKLEFINSSINSIIIHIYILITLLHNITITRIKNISLRCD